MKKDIIFMDCDGTLYDNKNKTVHKETVEALNILKEKYELGLATGRGLNALREVKKLLPYFDFKVLLNGNYVLYKDQVLYENYLYNEDIIKLKDYCETNDIALGYVSSNDYRITKINNKVIEAFDHFNERFPDIDKNYYLNNKIYQIWLFKYIDEDINLFPNLKFMKWQKEGYDVVNKDSDKSIGIKAIKNQFNFNKVITFGDGQNDIQMLQESDISIAMGNSNDNVKGIATYTTDTVENNGIYEFVKKNIL